MKLNAIVVKLWNGSKALQISRNGLDCQTDGLMIYKILIHAPEKKRHSGSYFQVTIELQYANKIDSVPFQWTVLYLLILTNNGQGVDRC